MATTSLGIPYPLLTDAPNGPSEMAALAAATDTLLIAALNTGDLYGETQGAANVNLTAIATTFAMTDSKVTWTQATQRRVTVKVRILGNAASVPAVILAYTKVVAGSTATMTGALAGNSGQQSLPTAGGPGQCTVDCESTFLLAAGTWTAFCGARCTNQTDASATNGYTVVYDAGSN